MRYPQLVRLSCALTLCLSLVLLIGCTSAPMNRAVAAEFTDAAPRATPAAAPARPQTGPAKAVEATPAPTHRRQIIYTGSVTLTTPDAPEAMLRIEREAVALGGFLHKWESNTITIRVPVARFHEAYTRIAALGSLSDKSIRALDVTDQLRDLDARIANTDAMRKRLIALLEKTGEMEAMLKVEKQLQRVTEELERLKARRLAISESAAFSTLAVKVIEAQPVRRPTFAANMPFAWINQVGTELRSGRSFNRADRKFGKGVKVELPKGFVRFWQENHKTVAMSSARVTLKVQRQKNFDEADATFWADLIEDHLTQSSLIKVDGRDTLAVRDQDIAVMLKGSKAFGQGDYGYLIAVVTSDSYVYTYEAWGPIASFTAALPALTESVQTLKVDSGW